MQFYVAVLGTARHLAATATQGRGCRDWGWWIIHPDACSDAPSALAGVSLERVKGRGASIAFGSGFLGLPRLSPECAVDDPS